MFLISYVRLNSNLVIYMFYIIRFNKNKILSIFHCYEYRLKHDTSNKTKLITYFDLDEYLKSYD